MLHQLRSLLHKGCVIIYGRGGAVQIKKLRVLKMRPPSERANYVLTPPPRIPRTVILPPPPEHQYIDMYCRLSYHSLYKYIMSNEILRKQIWYKIQ